MVIRKLAFFLSLVVAGSALILAMPHGSQAADIQASTVIQDANGKALGTATFVESASKDVTITVDVGGLQPGLHGMHIHTVGSCVPSDFTSAGGHFNPDNHKHGLQTSDGPHAGDLPNLVVGPDGRAHFQMTVSRVTLSAGKYSLFDADGSALVIHAAADDGMTDATGNSGARVACGVVSLGAAPATALPSNIPALAPPSAGDAGLAALFLCHRES
jgi:Cu-Zn family superoxide dismutase